MSSENRGYILIQVLTILYYVTKALYKHTESFLWFNVCKLSSLFKYQHLFLKHIQQSKITIRL